MKRAIILIAALAVVVTACSPENDSSSITLYSGRSEILIQPVLDSFMESTGIKVVVKYAGSADLAATILEEGGSSPADVFLSQDPASLGSIALDGLFDTLPAAILSRVPTRFSDDDGQWVGTSGRARVVVYDANQVDPASLPAKEDGFVDDVWSGRIGIAPTNGSFLAFVATKILVDGEGATLAWLDGMAANDSQKYPKNSPIVAAVNAGEIDAGLVNHYYLLRALAENPDEPGRNHFFTVATPGSLVMPAGAGVLATSTNKDASHRLIEFLLSDESQRYFAEETFEYPLVPGIDADPSLPAIETIPTPAINLSDLATVLDLATDLVAQAGLL